MKQSKFVMTFASGMQANSTGKIALLSASPVDVFNRSPDLRISPRNPVTLSILPTGIPAIEEDNLQPPPPGHRLLAQSYMAPEILADCVERMGYDKPVDLWAVGVITHEILTGRSPFRWVEPLQLGLGVGIARLVTLPWPIRQPKRGSGVSVDPVYLFSRSLASASSALRLTDDPVPEVE